MIRIHFGSMWKVAAVAGVLLTVPTPQADAAAASGSCQSQSSDSPCKPHPDWDCITPTETKLLHCAGTACGDG